MTQVRVEARLVKIHNFCSLFPRLRPPSFLSLAVRGEPGNEAPPSFLLLAVRGEPGNEANFFVLYCKHLLVF